MHKNSADDDGEIVQRVALIRARERRGLSRNELADQLDLHPTFIYRVEEGLRSPSLPTMERWAAVLETTMDVFRTSDEAA
jgi:transcriptional regulator with XRE-family HTH domain